MGCRRATSVKMYNLGMAEQQIRDEKGSAGEDHPEPAPSSLIPEKKLPKEIGGPAGPEPTRYGDWERKGRCIDF